MEFTLSAPGKIILYGEHSVVYGKSAVASSVDLRTRLEFQQNNSSDVNFICSAINLNYTFNVVSLNALVVDIYEVITNTEYVNDNHERILKQVSQYVDSSVSKEINLTDSQRNALYSFVFLMASVLSSSGNIISMSGCIIKITTDIRVGSGLGSSASFAVCLAGCFLYFIKRTAFIAQDLDAVSEWAFQSEKIMHGTPSGLDNCVCTYGSMVEFVKGQKPVALQCNAGESAALRVILVDTLVPRQTKAMVNGVKELMKRHPDVVDSILNSMDKVANTAAKILTSDCSEKHSRLRELTKINQALLVSLGVSHPIIDNICRIAQNKFVAAKLTGAGGGGYCIVLISPDIQTDARSLVKDFENEGYCCTETTLGGPGLMLDKTNM